MQLIERPWLKMRRQFQIALFQRSPNTENEVDFVDRGVFDKQVATRQAGLPQGLPVASATYLPEAYLLTKSAAIGFYLGISGHRYGTVAAV